MKQKLIRKTNLALLAGSLATAAHGQAVALYDFSNGRGTATAQNFMNVGVTGVEETDEVTVVPNDLLLAAVNETPFPIGKGLSVTIDNTANGFTYPNSPWSGDPDIALMGDAWLFNFLGATGRKNLTISGLSTLLAPSSAYTITFLGSYSGPEYTKYENVTYDGQNLGTIDSTQPVIDEFGTVTNFAEMANAAFTFTTGATVADELTFALGKATGMTGNAPGIQGIAIVPAPAPPAGPIQLSIASSGNTLNFSWNSNSGKQYNLVSSTDLATPVAEWAPYNDGVSTYENLPASPTGTNTLTGVIQLDSQRFFAIVEQPVVATN